MSVFRKGSYRYKIVEGLRVLPQDNVAKFVQIFGSGASQTIAEVVTGIPDKELKNALAIVERTEERLRKQIQAAAKKYIDDVNRAAPPITSNENKRAIYDAANAVLPNGDKSGVIEIVELMGKMSREIILGTVDDLIKRKSPTNLPYNLTPEEIERFISGMKEGIDPNTGVKVSKIGFFNEPVNYGNTSPMSDLVLRSDGSDASHKIEIPRTSPKISPEFAKARSALAAELVDLQNLTSHTGWFDEDTPAIPVGLLMEAQRILYGLPIQDRYLPKSVSVAPYKSTVVFSWSANKKSVKVTIGGTDVPGLHYIEYVNKAMPQDHDERFSELSDVTMFVLIKFLDRMFT